MGYEQVKMRLLNVNNVIKIIIKQLFNCNCEMNIVHKEIETN